MGWLDGTLSFDTADFDLDGMTAVETAGGTSIEAEKGGFLSGASSFLTGVGEFISPILSGVLSGGRTTAPSSSPYYGPSRQPAASGPSTTTILFWMAVVLGIVLITKKA